ncbi:MAG: hypothetical protein QXW04_01950 [Candidatus Aenigmatarchaeota archaeon]|nr:hypothetical protein [Candidatus Aenigmarchaeota archaeon]
MGFEDKIIKEEIAGIVNALLMLKIKIEGKVVFDKISKNLESVIYNVLEKGFVDELDALSIFGFVAY